MLVISEKTVERHRASPALTGADHPPAHQPDRHARWRLADIDLHARRHVLFALRA
jgi:hypothetical protein